MLRTLATLLLWLRSLHVLRLSSTAGPLVLMVGRMLRRDVFNWLLVLGCILLSFSAALFVLHGGGEYVACLQPDAFHLGGGGGIGSGGAWAAQALWHLRGVWEDALLSEAHFECTHAALLPGLAVPLAYLLQVLVALLLLNMLIAMMGKTFDNIYEAQEFNFLFLFCQTVTTWRDASPAPPPLNLLALPYEGGRLGVRLAAAPEAPKSEPASWH